MKNIIQFVFICFPCLLLGQDYLDYYSQINEAKKCVLQKEYQQALKVYKQVFKSFDFESEYGKNNYGNYGFYGNKFQPDMNKNLNKKRAKIGLLESKYIEQLNQQKIFTKFWNRLY